MTQRFKTVVLLFALFFSVAPIHAQELEGVGSIRFTLKGPVETPGVTGPWTLLRPSNERTEGTDTEFSFSELPAGTYVFTTILPEGTSATIDVLVNGQHKETIDRPQISIALKGGENYSLEVQYAYTQAGTVAVNSNPAGLGFTLKGPNAMEFTGETPASYQNVPIGQYTAYFDEIEGCKSLPPKSDKLVKDSRITLSIDVVCENLDISDIGQQEQRALEFVTVTVDGRQVTFEDVRTADWFAPFVSRMAKAAIITGYKDIHGIANGTFGPQNNVTVAELAKIAHEAAGIDEKLARQPLQNTRARGQWFEQYFASAEQNWWEVWGDTRLDPSRPATRAEVIVTILRALDVPRVWAKGKMFADIRPDDRYAAAIETAAVDGIIDAGGSFRPNDPINRAEIAKIISNAIDAYVEDTLEVQGGSR